MMHAPSSMLHCWIVLIIQLTSMDALFPSVCGSWPTHGAKRLKYYSISVGAWTPMQFTLRLLTLPISSFILVWVSDEHSISIQGHSQLIDGIMSAYQCITRQAAAPESISAWSIYVNGTKYLENQQYSISINGAFPVLPTSTQLHRTILDNP